MEKLKFELVNGYGVLVDTTEKDTPEGNLVIHIESKKIRRVTEYLSQHEFTILFAEAELCLDVPVFEWRDFEIKRLALKETEAKEWNAENYFIQGYKANPARYTKTDVLSIVNEYLHWLTKNRNSEIKGEDIVLELLNKYSKEYPQYVVMEMEYFKKNGMIDEASSIRPKLFINSQGKQQGIVKELIW